MYGLLCLMSALNAGAFVALVEVLRTYARGLVV